MVEALGGQSITEPFLLLGWRHDDDSGDALKDLLGGCPVTVCEAQRRSLLDRQLWLANRRRRGRHHRHRHGRFGRRRWKPTTELPRVASGAHWWSLLLLLLACYTSSPPVIIISSQLSRVKLS